MVSHVEVWMAWETLNVILFHEFLRLLQFLRHVKYVKLIHAAKVLQLHFVARMAFVVISILYSMQLTIMPMNVDVIVLITSQVFKNSANIA